MPEIDTLVAVPYSVLSEALAVVEADPKAAKTAKKLRDHVAGKDGPLQIANGGPEDWPVPPDGEPAQPPKTVKRTTKRG